MKSSLTLVPILNKILFTWLIPKKKRRAIISISHDRQSKNGIFLDQSPLLLFFFLSSTRDLVWILGSDTVYRFLSVTPYGHLRRRCLAVCEEATLVKHREGWKGEVGKKVIRQGWSVIGLDGWRRFLRFRVSRERGGKLSTTPWPQVDG